MAALNVTQQGILAYSDVGQVSSEAYPNIITHNVNYVYGSQRPDHPAVDDPDCAIFEFVLKVLLTGLLCLIAFSGNTVSFVILWQQRTQSDMTFLLQAIIIADLAVVWMLFIQEVVPGIGFVLPVLHHCTTVCEYVAAVTRPLLFFARSCVVWFTLAAATTRYMSISNPPSDSGVLTMDCARKQIILILVTCFVLTIPLTFDSVLHIVHFGPGNSRHVEPLIHNKWYRMVYLYGVLFVIVLLAPMLTMTYVSTRLIQTLQSIKKLRRLLLTIGRKTNTEMTQVMLTLCVALMVCYLPLIVLQVLGWVQGASPADRHCGRLVYYLHDFSNLFLALNSSLKVVIFALFKDKFLQGLKMCVCQRRHRYHTVKTTDSTPASMYKCQDMSEMTLISQVDGRV